MGVLSAMDKRAKQAYRKVQHRKARSAVESAIGETPYTWDELRRFEEYLAHAFLVRKPTYAAALQRPRRYFPGLEARPVWPADRFDFIDELAGSAADIEQELRSYRYHSELGVHHQQLNDAGSWNVFYLYAGGSLNEEAPAAFPKTLRAIDAVPGIGVSGQVYFSVLSAGTHVPPHCGPTNTRLRVHVPLVVPPGCEMRVGDHLHRWDDGHDVLVFDDSFEHEVWIRAQSERIVLILDFWHPGLTDAERWAVALVDPYMSDRRRYRKGAGAGDG